MKYHLHYTITLVATLIATFVFAQTSPEIVVTSGHISMITHTDFHPQGKMLATGSDDRTIKIWDKALKQEFRTLTGHQGNIRNLKFTPDGNYLISLGEPGEIIIWTYPEGKIMHRITLDAHITQMAITPDSKYVLTFAKGGVLTAYDIQTGQPFQSYKGLSNHIATHAINSNYFISHKNLQIAVYDRTSGEKVTDLPHPEKIFFQHIMTRKGCNYALGLTHQQDIYIWDLKTHQLKTSYKLPERFSSYAILNSKKLLACVNYMGIIKFFDLETGVEKHQIKDYEANPQKYTQNVYETAIMNSITVSPEEDLIAVGMTLVKKEEKIPTYRMETVGFWNTKDYRNLGFLKGYFKMITKLALNPDESLMFTSSYDKYNGTRLWDMKDGEVSMYLPSNGVADFSADGTAFAQLNLDKPKPTITVFQLPDMKEKFNFDQLQGLSHMALSADGQRIVVAYMNLVNNLPQHILEVWDINTQKSLFKSVLKAAPLMLKISRKGNYAVYQNLDEGLVCVNINTQKNAFSESKFIFSQSYALDFTTDEKKLIVSKILLEPDGKFVFKDGDFQSELMALDLNTGQSDGIPLPVKGKLICAHFSQDGKYLVAGEEKLVGNSQVWVLDWATKQRLCDFEGHNSKVNAVWFGGKGEKVYSVGMDGVIKVWEIKKCKMAASFIGMNRTDYIIQTPDNYYKASKGNMDGLAFRFQGRLCVFGQFDVLYNRPDLVMAQLGAEPAMIQLYKKAYEKRLERMGLSEKQLSFDIHLPFVEIPDKYDLPVATTNAKLNFKVKAIDEVEKISQIRIYVNDVPLFGAKGFDVLAQNKKIFEKDFGIELSAGKNRISVESVNEKGMISIAESFEITYQKNSSQPNLYLLAVGVSEYEDKARNLTYAAKDATDLTALLNNATNFNQKKIKLLTNQEATLENILETAKMFKDARTDDQVVLYMSGHGLLDEKLNYYLATNKVSFENPVQGGLPYDKIETLFDGIACRNRLIMIDACHSGELDKAEVVASVKTEEGEISFNNRKGNTTLKARVGLNNSFEYMKTLFNDFSNKAGATVISASGGMEYALESDSWNNGVFTYAILKGIQSGEADRDGNNYISVSELKEYVIEKVVELTKNKQVPTTRKENYYSDFPLYKIK